MFQLQMEKLQLKWYRYGKNEIVFCVFYVVSKTLWAIFQMVSFINILQADLRPQWFHINIKVGVSCEYLVAPVAMNTLIAVLAFLDIMSADTFS